MKGCKSIYDNVELGRRFNEMGKKFLRIHEIEATKVDFSAMEISRHACGTVACHGGFAALALDIKPRWAQYTYQLGADALAEFLGFENYGEMLLWAEENPRIWGSDYGHEMFSGCGHFAFTANRVEKDTREITLLVIAQWYANVASRLLGNVTREIIY